MWGHKLLQSLVVVWLVQTVYTKGFGAVSGVEMQGPQFNGRRPQNGGGTPSKGVGQVMGAQNGFGGYPAKGVGHGAATGVSNTNGAKYNGFGAAAGAQAGAALKGYGAVSGVSNGQRGKPQGYPAAGLGQGGQATKGNGNGAYRGAQNGYGPKHGQKAFGGPGSTNGAGMNGQAGAKPMKGYGRPPYGAGAMMGSYRGMGVPPQGSAYGSNGYGTKPMGGYRPSGAGVGLGSLYGNGGMKGPTGGGAGVGLGSLYGNGGMKGPKPGLVAVAGGANGQAKTPGTTGLNVNGAVANGYGYRAGGANKPGKPGYGSNGYGAKPIGYNMNRGGSVGPQPGYTNGPGTGGFGGKPKVYAQAAGQTGALKGNGAKSNGQGISNGAALGGYGNKLNGFGVPGQTTGAGNAGYGTIPSGKPKSAGVLGGQGFKGGLLSAAGPTVPQQSLSQGPEPTSALLGMVNPDQYQKLQGKGYNLEATAPPVLGPRYSLQSGPTPIPVLMGSGGKGSKISAAVAQSSGSLEPSVVLPQGYLTGSQVPGQSVEETDIGLGMNTEESERESESSKSLHTKDDSASEAAAGAVSPEVQSGTVPEETEGPRAAPTGLKGAGAFGTGGMATKGQGAVSPDCGPSGVPNGQWMKIPRPEYGAYAGPGASPHTKGYGAGAATPNGYGSKTNGLGAAAGGYPNGGAKLSQGAGAYAGVGQNNGYAPGFGYPSSGKPGYGQGAYLGAGYGGAGDRGKSKSGYGNGNVAGVQPDFASLQGQGVPSAQGKSSSKQSPYNGNGLNGFQPQSASLGPNGKVGTAYGGMGGMPFGGANPKYGIGGLQFGGNPSSSGTYGAGNYGGNPYGPTAGGKQSGKYGSVNGQQYLGLGSNANTPGKYGYGRMPHEIQTAGQSPKVKSSGEYESAYQPQPAAMGQNGKAMGQYGNIGGMQAPYAPQAFGTGAGAKSAEKYGGQGGYKSQPLETAAVTSEAASLPLESSTGAKSYVKGETPTAAAVEGASMDRYDHVGYISGQVQPEVVSFPAAPTHQPSAPYPTAAPYLPVDASAFGEGGTKGVKGAVDSAPVTESQAALGQEATDEQQQMPQQIHIQQHLKLHFHPQGGDEGKYDLNGFFGNANGNSGYKS